MLSRAATQYVSARLLNTVMAALGPELQMNDKTRETCLLLCYHLRCVDNDMVAVGSCTCTQTLVVFAGQYVKVPEVLPHVKRCLRRYVLSFRAHTFAFVCPQ